MRECVDCGRHFSAKACPGCGWNPPPDQPRSHPISPPPDRVIHYPGMAAIASQTIQSVLSGRMTVDQLVAWCEEAERKWPLIGWAQAAEVLRNRPRPAARARVREGQAALDAWEKAPWTSRQRSQEELERQKEVLRGMDGQAVSEEVTF